MSTHRALIQLPAPEGVEGLQRFRIDPAHADLPLGEVDALSADDALAAYKAAVGVVSFGREPIVSVLE